MGKKGDKLSNASTIVAEQIVERLAAIGGVTTKKMFGGHGIFHDSKMFGLIDSRGQTFFKATEDLKAAYEDMGSEQHSRMPYFSVPDSILDDQDELTSWANKSIEISK